MFLSFSRCNHSREPLYIFCVYIFFQVTCESVFGMIFLKWFCTLSFLLSLISAKTESIQAEYYPEDCLIDIIERIKAECNYLVYTDMKHHHLVTKIMQSERSIINVYINGTINSLDVYGDSYVYIVLAESVADYHAFLKTFELSAVWNPQEWFLIVYFGESGIEEILKLSHKHLVHQLLILTHSQLLSYFPFKNGSCAYTSVIQNHNCTDISALTFTRNIALLQYTDCQLRITTVPFIPYTINVSDRRNSGLDMQIIYEVSSHLNISTELLENKNNYTSWGGVLKNGTYTMMYGLLVRREADILVGMTHANATVDKIFASTIPHMQDHVNFFVPAALPVIAWKVFVLALESSVWLLLLAAFVIMFLACWFIGSTRNMPRGYDKLEYCFFKVLCTWFSSHSYLPQTILLRYLFTIWCFTSILINSLYQGKLMSYLTKPVYEKQISTMLELSESHLLKGGFPTLKSHLDDDKDNKALEKIKEQWILCELDYSCINRTSEKRDIAVAKSVIGIKYNIPRMYLDSNGRSKIFQLKDTLSLYLVRFTAVKGLPFFDRMNTLIAFLIDSGIVNKWLNDLQSNKKYEYRDEFRKISLEHLQIVVVVFFCGHTLALLVFLLERFNHKRERRFKQTVHQINPH